MKTNEQTNYMYNDKNNNKIELCRELLSVWPQETTEEIEKTRHKSTIMWQYGLGEQMSTMHTVGIFLGGTTNDKMNSWKRLGSNRMTPNTILDERNWNEQATCK